jgi:1-acyl-sn-glycerol-3-phosphate acyltransferase
MEYNPEFEKIRPFEGEEIPEAIERLLNEERFELAVKFAIPDVDYEKFSEKMRSFKNTYEFQKDVVSSFLFNMAKGTTSSLSITGVENVSNSKQYTYISNHRDIVLDAAFFNILLFNQGKGFDTTEVAIGDNLLIYPWINDLVKINKSFIVHRGVSKRQVLEVSKLLSSYIHYTLKEKKRSVWIAQREGRAKDSDDRTQESVLKMLSLGGEGCFLENIKDVNIVPLSITYEYDPCDYLKAKEFQLKRDDAEYRKQNIDDLQNMETGLFGFKGNVNFHIGKPINPDVELIPSDSDKACQVASVGKLIDNEIYKNYRIYPGNYAAYDMLHKSSLFSNKYTPEEKLVFEHHLKKCIDKINIPNKDIDFLTLKLLEMYANPLKNQLAAKKEQ